MPRHDASKPGFKLPAKAVLADPTLYLDLPSRDLSNPQSLQQLFHLCESLETWAKRFAPTAPLFALTAASTSEGALAHLLESIIDELDALAPRCSPDARQPQREQREPGKPWQRTGLLRVEDLVNVLALLPEYVLGTFEYEPETVDTGGQVPSGAAWRRSWRPSDDETVVYVRDRIIELRELERLDIPPKELQKMHDRIAVLSRSSVRDLKRLMNAPDEDVGFRQIKRLIAEHDRPDLVGVYRGLAAAVGDLASVASENAGAPLFSSRWRKAVVSLLKAHDEYSTRCLPLLRALPMNRSGLERKRKQLRGWVAITSQYAFLVRGNAIRLKAASVFEGIRLAAKEICAELRSIDGLVTDSNSEDDLHKATRRYDQLIVDPSLLALWKERLGTEKSTKCGMMSHAIATSKEPQTSPWTLGDRATELKTAGVLSRKAIRDRKDQLQELLFEMQEIGLAIQVPWDYVAGKSTARQVFDKCKPLSRRGLGWLVNPMGAALIDPLA